MTVKTEDLLSEITEALYQKKAVLLTGSTGVGKTYLAKRISEQLSKSEYSCFPSSEDQRVNVEIISCHNSVTYEDVVGGISADTESGKMTFEYKDKILLETVIKAAEDYKKGKGSKYVLIMDDLQRNDVSTLVGDAINAIGSEGKETKLYLNSGSVIMVPPNFYVIGTYNSTEAGAIALSSDLMRKFYVREILSDIEYITEDSEAENAVYYDQVRSLVFNYLDMQYRLSTYDQNRYFLGHGYFSGDNVALKIRYQLIPILKQYISEGILDRAASESVRLLEAACIKTKTATPRFNVTVVELLNYIRDDDEFDRYMAPQTISNRHKEKDIEAIDRNEIFYFFENEKPLKVDGGISSENSIITVTVFLTLLRLLCRRPLMGRMLKEEENLTGKVKGKIVIEKNIRSNTMHGRNDRFYCQYLRFSDDIIENQILKAALRKAKRFIVDYFGDYSKDNNNYASMISYCSNALRHISDIQCSGTACNGLKFSGCYTYYKPVMAMARMVLDDISVESNGEISTTGYIVPYAISMEKLFEVYVRAYLKKNGIESYRSKSDKGIRLEKYDNKTDVFMEEEGLSNPGKYISGSIKPDLILTDRESGETVVFDVKYKDYTNGDSRNDRLQLLAYSMMMNANNDTDMLPSTTVGYVGFEKEAIISHDVFEESAIMASVLKYSVSCDNVALKESIKEIPKDYVDSFVGKGQKIIFVNPELEQDDVSPLKRTLKDPWFDRIFNKAIDINVPRMTTPTTASMSNNSEVDYTIDFKVKLFKNILGEKHASIH